MVVYFRRRPLSVDLSRRVDSIVICRTMAGRDSLTCDDIVRDTELTNLRKAVNSQGSERTSSDVFPPVVEAPRVSQQWVYKNPSLSGFGVHAPDGVVLELSASDVSYGAGSAPKYIGPYLLGDQLGEGSYGKVKEALNTQSHSMIEERVYTNIAQKFMP